MTMFTEETSADWNNVIEYFVRIGDFYFPTDEQRLRRSFSEGTRMDTEGLYCEK